MRQILGAMTYCHSLNVVHRDLKPENILIDSKLGNKMNVKVIDFGASLICPKNKKIKELAGTTYYIAPEVFDGTYTAKCDVWSLGVILYIMLSGIPPFNGNSDEEIEDAIKEGNLTFRGNCY